MQYSLDDVKGLLFVEVVGHNSPVAVVVAIVELRDMLAQLV